MPSLTNFELPKYRKGTQVMICQNGVITTVEKITIAPTVGYLYNLKNINGAYAEVELTEPPVNK